MYSEKTILVKYRSAWNSKKFTAITLNSFEDFYDSIMVWYRYENKHAIPFWAFMSICILNEVNLKTITTNSVGGFQL